MTEEEIKQMLDQVSSMEEEAVIVLLAVIAEAKGINTHISKIPSLKMQVILLDEKKYEINKITLRKLGLITNIL